MEVSPLVISRSEGMVSQFVSEDNQLDVEGFEKQWHKDKAMTGLQLIAQKHLGLDDLKQDKATQQALLEAINWERAMSRLASRSNNSFSDIICLSPL